MLFNIFEHLNLMGDNQDFINLFDDEGRKHPSETYWITKLIHVNTTFLLKY